MVNGCEVYYDPKNMTREQAVEQYKKHQDEAGTSVFSKFTASIARKGEPWIEALRQIKRSMKRDNMEGVAFA